MTIISQKVKMVFLSNICVMQHFQKREAFLTCLITDALPWSHVVLQPSRKQDVSIYQDYDRLQSNGVVIVTVSSDEEDNGKQVVLSGVTDIDQGLQPKVEFTCKITRFLHLCHYKEKYENIGNRNEQIPDLLWEKHPCLYCQLV